MVHTQSGYKKRCYRRSKKKDSFKIILIKLRDQWTVKQVCFPVGLCHWLTVEPLVWMCFPNGWAELTSEWQCFSPRLMQPQKCKLCWTLKNKVSHCPRENAISICKESIFDSNLYFNSDSEVEGNYKPLSKSKPTSIPKWASALWFWFFVYKLHGHLTLCLINSSLAML